jgi:hypothetical protein
MVVKGDLPFNDQGRSVAGILDALNQLNQKLESLVSFNAQILRVNEALLEKIAVLSSGWVKADNFSHDPDAFALLSLPLSLRKTVMVLYRLERATADDLARETGRLRAVESASANQLVRMGYLKKIREGRDVFFYIDVPSEGRS